jgi:hypothetical protein
VKTESPMNSLARSMLIQFGVGVSPGSGGCSKTSPLDGWNEVSVHTMCFLSAHIEESVTKIGDPPVSLGQRPRTLHIWREAPRRSPVSVITNSTAIRRIAQNSVSLVMSSKCAIHSLIVQPVLDSPHWPNRIDSDAKIFTGDPKGLWSSPALAVLAP